MTDTSWAFENGERHVLRSPAKSASNSVFACVKLRFRGLACSEGRPASDTDSRNRVVYLARSFPGRPAALHRLPGGDVPRKTPVLIPIEQSGSRNVRQVDVAAGRRRPWHSDTLKTRTGPRPRRREGAVPPKVGLALFSVPPDRYPSLSAPCQANEMVVSLKRESTLILSGMIFCSHAHWIAISNPLRLASTPIGGNGSGRPPSVRSRLSPIMR